MRAEEYQRIRTIFLAAREQPAAQRAAFLAQACGDDEALRDQVQRLLENAARDDSFLRDPALGTDFAVPTPQEFACAAAGSSDHPDRHAPDAVRFASHPQSIGAYRILDLLGQGGMGVVYRAEQAHPRRIVALKVIRPGQQSPALLRRFQHEGEVLGWLRHPGIAQIYEAGTAQTDAGIQPFFAMELVQGEPLTRYADQQQLDTRARVRLLARVSDAVHHAHQRGVIHRDLKPGNILVDETGQPKILDFGIARATDSDLRSTTVQTSIGQLVGTLAYMSPEQLLGDPTQLDTRADVYALGVLGFELLTCRLPVEVTGKTLPDAIRTINETEPPAAGRVRRELRGELETILAKALAKDKEQRYASAADLADDLRRFLADQPIKARPATTLYQLRKFALRNKPLFGGVVVAFAALLVCVVGTTALTFRATRERNRALDAERVAEERRAEAEAQAAIARAVNDFLNDDLLAAARPEELGRDATVRQVVDKAAEVVSERFRDQPLVAANIHLTLGSTYQALGEYTPARTQLETARQVLLEHAGADDPQTIRALSRLGLLCVSQGHLADAESYLTCALERSRRVNGEADSRTLATSNHLALLYMRQGRFAEAEQLLHGILSLAAPRREDSNNVITARANLAEALARQNRLDEAEPLYLQALEQQRRRHGDDDPSTVSIVAGLATLYTRQKQYDQAASFMIQTLEARRRLLGDEHPKTLGSLNNLALLYKAMGRLADAEQLLLQVRESKRRVLGEEHPQTLNTVNNLASLYSAQGRYDEAEQLFLQVIDARRRVLGKDHHQTVSALGNLADLYDLQGRADEAAQCRSQVPGTEPGPSEAGRVFDGD